MTTWAEDELHRIAETDDLHISPFREDGKSLTQLESAGMPRPVSIPEVMGFCGE